MSQMMFSLKKAQAADDDFNFVIDFLLEENHSSPDQTENHSINLRYPFKNGVKR